MLQAIDDRGVIDNFKALHNLYFFPATLGPGPHDGDLAQNGSCHGNAGAHASRCARLHCRPCLEKLLA